MKQIEYLTFRCRRCGHRKNTVPKGSQALEDRLCFECFVRKKYGKERLKDLQPIIL